MEQIQDMNGGITMENAVDETFGLKPRYDMQTLDEYMKLPYRMEITEDREEGGYVVKYPDLPGCITCGDTQEEAIRNAENAKKEWIIAAMEEKLTIPMP